MPTEWQVCYTMKPKDQTGWPEAILAGYLLVRLARPRTNSKEDQHSSYRMIKLK